MKINPSNPVAIVVSFASLALTASARNPVESGDVKWTRDFDAALAKSAESKKPVFAFFQEIPGCVGCQKFGAEVMTHPLLVEAIENEFIPVLIYNNRPGYDAEILKRYSEPAWNYQVIRFLDGKGKDLIPRKDQVWTVNGIANRMIDALEKAKRPVPGYLRTVAAESTSENSLRTAGFAMDCFWTGEMKLGGIEGVVRTEAGWLEGREVTRVTYDPNVISFASLVKQAQRHECGNKVYASTDAEIATAKEIGRVTVGRPGSGFRPADSSDQKKQLQGTAFANLPLSPMQATKVNAFARTDPKKALTWLSPSQRARIK